MGKKKKILSRPQQLQFHLAVHSRVVFHTAAAAEHSQVGYLAEVLEVCSLLPVTRHPTAHCSLPVIFKAEQLSSSKQKTSEGVISEIEYVVLQACQFFSELFGL